MSQSKSITDMIATKVNNSGYNVKELLAIPDFWEKLNVVLKDNAPEYMKEFAISIIRFIDDWGIVTKKQFLSVMKLADSAKAYKESMRESGFCVKTQKGHLNVCGTIGFFSSDMFTWKNEKEYDYLYTKLFGPPRFEECEEEGLELSYTKTGKRIFLFPEE